MATTTKLPPGITKDQLDEAIRYSEKHSSFEAITKKVRETVRSKIEASDKVKVQEAEDKAALEFTDKLRQAMNHQHELEASTIETGEEIERKLGLKKRPAGQISNPDEGMREAANFAQARSVLCDTNRAVWQVAAKNPVLAKSLQKNEVPYVEPVRAYHAFGVLTRSLARSCDWRGPGTVPEGDRNLLRQVTGLPLPGARGIRLPNSWVEDMLGIPQGTITRTGTESVSGAQYGFAVAPDWSTTLFRRRRQLRGPLADCVWLPSKSLEFRYPAVDETSVSAGSMAGGVSMVRRQLETTTLSTALATDGDMAMIVFRLEDAFVYSTPFSRDLFADQYGVLEEWIGTTFYQEFRERMESWMFLGTGTGSGASETVGFSGLGVINAPCTVVVTRNTAGALGPLDIDNMLQALWGPSIERACWYCSKSAYVQLRTGIGTNGMPVINEYPQGNNNASLFTHGASMGGNVFPLMAGRPLIVMNQLPAYGTKGDLVLADFSQYGMAYHRMDNTQSSWEAFAGLPGESVENMRSEHVWFDTDQVQLRLKARIDCKPLWKSSVTDKNSIRVSPFVVVS